MTHSDKQRAAKQTIDELNDFDDVRRFSNACWYATDYLPWHLEEVFTDQARRDTCKAAIEAFHENHDHPLEHICELVIEDTSEFDQAWAILKLFIL